MGAVGAHGRGGLIRRLRHLDPFAPPGEAFQYSNLMVAAAGLVAAGRRSCRDADGEVWLGLRLDRPDTREL